MSSSRPRSRLVDSPSKTVPYESLMRTPQEGEDIFVEAVTSHQAYISRDVSRRASTKSLNVISDSDSENVPAAVVEDESSGDHINSSELYDTRAHPSPDDSSAHSLTAKSVLSQTPIADRYSAPVSSPQRDPVYSSGTSTSGLSSLFNLKTDY